MERTDRIASHSGTVVGTKPGQVTVGIEAVSACAACQAHGHCGFAESKNKTLDIPTPRWQEYAEGDSVTVHVSRDRGLLAAAIAYVLPALLLIGVSVGLSLAGLAEGVVILSALGTLALYVLALYLLRHRIGNKFTLKIEKQTC